MKTPKLKLLSSIIISFFVAVSALCCTLIISFPGFVNSKYGIVLIISGAVGFLSYLVLTGSEKCIENRYTDRIEREVQLRKEYGEDAAFLTDENNKLRAKISELEKKPETESEYKEKYTNLKAFQDSFPLVIDPLFVIHNIMRTELRVGKYSRWLIVGEADNELFSCPVLRQDVQSLKEMLTLAKGCRTVDELAEIDQSKMLICE